MACTLPDSNIAWAAVRVLEEATRDAEGDAKAPSGLRQTKFSESSELKSTPVAGADTPLLHQI